MTTKPPFNTIIAFREIKDYENFSYDLKNQLSCLNPVIRKKIIIIATELIQNNIIHNNSKPCVLSINVQKNYVYFEINQLTEADKLKKIRETLASINELSETSLKDIYKNNISNFNKKNVGNGLILCRLKSGNKIGLLSEKTDNENIYSFTLAIKLKHYDK